MGKFKLYISAICINIDMLMCAAKDTYNNFIEDVGMLGFLIITLSMAISSGLVLKLIFQFVL
jgi:hypothetical protein